MKTLAILFLVLIIAGFLIQLLAFSMMDTSNKSWPLFTLGKALWAVAGIILLLLLLGILGVRLSVVN